MPDARGLTAAISLREHNIVHAGRINLRPLDKRFQYDATQLACV
jgi:hypothetical protein